MHRLWAALAALALAGCATGRPLPSITSTPRDRGSSAAPGGGSAEAAGVSSMANLLGWREEDHVAALSAFRAGCGTARDMAMQRVCRKAQALGAVDDPAAEQFFEANFRPEILPGPGLLTAYYAPEYEARREPDPVFTVALRARPDDMVLVDPGPGDPVGRKVPKLSVDGALSPYPDRIAIELVSPEHPLAWMRPEDLFFLQIQGSGGLVLPDGERFKAIYAADNGRPFVAIASQMVKRGLITPAHESGDGIHAWLAEHRGEQAQAVMNLDPRYVFFSLVPDDGRDPTGAAGLPLSPGRAVAIDPAWHRYGELYWVDAVSPTLAGAVKTYRRVVVALDTGSAIRGNVRADLYLGRGEAAGLEAGRVRHTLVLARLVPIG